MKESSYGERTWELPNDGQIKRKRVLSEIKEDREGLDIGRVRSFLHEYGMALPDMVIANRESQGKKLWNILGMTEEINGQYYPYIDAVVLARDEAFEQANGPAFFESIIVHEATHADAAHEGFVNDGYDYYRLTHQGFWEIDEGGLFWEEATAEQKAVNYRKLYISDEFRKKVRTSDAFNNAHLQYPNTNISEHYFRIDEKTNEVKLQGYGYAALALEMILQKIPGSADFLRKARFDTKSRQTFKDLVNSLRSGLYEDCAKLNSFRTGFEMIRKAVLQF